MIRCPSIKQLQFEVDLFRQKNPGQTVTFVPTMGYLHQGHISLVKKAKETGDYCIVSIFVNRAQFNQQSDFDKYPVDFQHDEEILRGLGVDLLFHPAESEIYPHGLPDIVLDYPGLTDRLCGANRPGHFQGVLLIVHNLLQWVLPDFAIFGEKDYQQFLLIRRMCHDLALPVEIMGAPLVREENGLALSSRNARLTAGGRKQALAISKSLLAVQDLWARDPSFTVEKAEEILDEGLKSLKIDYAGIYDLESLAPLEKESAIQSALVAVAAWVDGIRLIDNVILGKPTSPGIATTG